MGGGSGHDAKRGDTVWVVAGDWNGCRARVVELLPTRIRVQILDEDRAPMVDLFTSEISGTRPRSRSE